MTSLATSFLRALTAPEPFNSDPNSFGSAHLASTAAVTVAAVRRACELKGEAVRDQKIVIRGAGARGLSVARALRNAMQPFGFTWRETASRVLVVDTAGLLLEGADRSAGHRRFATPMETINRWSFRGERPDLLETIANSGATILIGLSGESNAFTRPVVRAMCANVASPIILPLSWPEDRREASTQDVEAWSEGEAIAIGPEVGPQGAGCAEAWTLPGLALGALIAQASIIDFDMVMAAAKGLHAQSAERECRVLPTEDELAETTQRIAIAVVRAAMRSGAATNPDLSFTGLDEMVRARMSDPAGQDGPLGEDTWAADHFE